jgi:excisionase family DNA binding protein
MSDATHKLDPVLSIKEAAKALSLHRITLYRLLQAGEGPPTVQLTRTRYGIRTSDLNAWVTARLVAPGAAAPAGSDP